VRVAAVDVGTNSTRLLVADGVDGGLRRLERRSVITGLGRGVDATGRLGPEAVDRTIGVLAAYRTAIESAGVERSLAVATSATRDAVNRDEFLDAAEMMLGIRPEVIDGSVEAGLTFVGATSELRRRAPFLVIDPGGGSTEFVFGSDTPESVHSIDIGSVRVTERWLPQRPVAGPDLLSAAAAVESVFSRVELPQAPATAIGVGTTFTSLAAIALDLPVHDRLVVHHSTLSLDALGSVVTHLAALGIEETAAIPSVDPERAPMLLGGAIVAEAAVRHCGLGEITISEADLLDGVALRVLEDAG
jgi:exopolyphosphatase/guanosine-5'-triphosphate,3'-diphosphate pyrophosphatase